MEGCFRHRPLCNHTRLSALTVVSCKGRASHACIIWLLSPKSAPAHALAHSVIHLLIHSLIHAPTLSSHFLIHSVLHSIMHSLIYTHSYIFLYTHSVWGLRSCASLEQVHPLGGQVCSEQQEPLHAQPLSLSAWGCLKQGGSPQWVPLESEEMSLLPRHQSSINNRAACSQWQALWKPQSQERWGECVRKELAGCPRRRLCQCSILPERVLGATLTALSPSYLSQL